MKPVLLLLIPIMISVPALRAQTTGAAVQPAQTAYSIRLTQNYPNPFNPTTRISYRLPSAGEVSLKVYNLIGQEVATLDAGFRSAGIHTVQFDATSLPSGIYLYKLQSGAFVETRRMALVR